MSPKNFTDTIEAHYYHFCVRLEEDRLNLANPAETQNWVIQQLNFNNQDQIIPHAFVYMGDHFHAILDLNGNSPYCFQGALSQLWKPIYSYSAYLETYRYIYRNPIEARLCSTPEVYPYSSLSWMLGIFNNPGLVIYDHLRLIQNPQKIVRWIKGGLSPFQTPIERYLW